jgi:hypothetical protein
LRIKGGSDRASKRGGDEEIKTGDHPNKIARLYRDDVIMGQLVRDTIYSSDPYQATRTIARSSHLLIDNCSSSAEWELDRVATCGLNLHEHEQQDFRAC